MFQGDTIRISCNNPQRNPAQGQAASLPVDLTCSYTTPGVYTPWIRITNSNGDTLFEDLRTVTVVEASAPLAVTRDVYGTLIDQLKANNQATALNQFFGHARTKYDEIFTALGADLAMFAGQIGTIASVSAGEGVASITLIRDVAGVKRTFFIKMMQGEDGIWRIESM